MEPELCMKNIFAGWSYLEASVCLSVSTHNRCFTSFLHKRLVLMWGSHGSRATRRRKVYYFCFCSTNYSEKTKKVSESLELRLHRRTSSEHLFLGTEQKSKRKWCICEISWRNYGHSLIRNVLQNQNYELKEDKRFYRAAELETGSKRFGIM